MISTEKLGNLLHYPQDIAILTHPNPDGDAMGSSFGLYNYLTRKNHRVSVILPTSYAEFLNWFPGIKKALIYPHHKNQIETLLQTASILFCLDFNSLIRLNEIGDMVRNAKATKVIIDHHQQPEDFADILLSDVHVSSTAELVYDFIISMGDEPLINADIAACLYAGIMTDTGSFQFSSTSPKTHRIAASLIEKGIDFVNIHRRLNNSFSENRLRLFGFSIIERMKIYTDYHCAMIWLTREDLMRFEVKTGDTEGLVNYPLKIKGINMSALIIDRTEQIKLSFRSVGTFDVNQFCRKHFNGGGHINAAGGQSKLPLEEVIRQFENLLPQYQQQLNY